MSKDGKIQVMRNAGKQEKNEKNANSSLRLFLFSRIPYSIFFVCGFSADVTPQRDAMSKDGKYQVMRNAGKE